MNRTIDIQISGMHCDHCIHAIRSALTDLPGVGDCSVELGSARVTFDEAATKKSDLVSAIRRAGTYEVTGFSLSDVA